MATMESAYLQSIREQLELRLARLEGLLEQQPTEQVEELITEVDKALERIDTGHFGECRVCHESVEAERLMHDPLISVCLGCLSPQQQRALEYDLQLAAQIHQGQLPAANLAIPGWQVAFHYHPAGVIGGDYFDVMGDGKGGAYFLIADVAGKGVSAAMLTANLRAVFRAMIPLGLEVSQLLAHANRLFCESKLPQQYATLVFGHASAMGELQIVNAGHLPVMLVRGSDVKLFESGCMPLGLFCEQQFPAVAAELVMGDMLLLFTDGVTETQNASGKEYGVAKLQRLIQEGKPTCPDSLIETCRECVHDFRGTGNHADDETMLAIQYMGTDARMMA
ncbi:MAG TPA: SpoIIE family protein phosphatase [Candidatus Bathyarchaeia archaeon]|nr:SpoIIE family protein phosphatase [Candidatus Bathyarchaeia archaeon]